MKKTAVQMIGAVQLSEDIRTTYSDALNVAVILFWPDIPRG